MLRLILGRAGSGKSSLCLKEINAKLEDNSSSFPLIYLVPEQSSFQAEYALASSAASGGSIRAQALSFKRLAWKVLRETAEKQELFIDDTGKSMMMLKVLEENKKKLRLFKHAGEQPGTLKNLVLLYNEMKRYSVNSSKLREILNQKKGEIPLLLQDKLADLSAIMEEMEQKMEGHYLDGEDTLRVLLRNIPHSKYLHGSEIWVDGFYDFTRLEYRILTSLLDISRKITITLCLERDYLPGDELPVNSPFYSSALTCRRLIEEASRKAVPVEKVLLPGKNRTRFSANGVLSHLEKNIFRFPAKRYPVQHKDDAKDFPIILATAPNRREEVEGAAHMLISLARDQGYRWRDMAVLAGNLQEYSDLITTVFQEYEIPFFLDQERPASFHPLVEFIRSSVEVITRGWRHDAVFRCIKTGFLFPLQKEENSVQKWRNKASRLENYVLALGIQGSRWLDGKPWKYPFRDTLEEELAGEADEGKKASEEEEKALAEINNTRQFFVTFLNAFQQEFRIATNVREKTSALFHFLENVSARERLDHWSKEDLKCGNLERSREHIQIYNGVINLLEQLVEIMGEIDVSSAQFLRILEAGLDNLSLSLVPPSLDRVVVGDIERTRPGKIRCAFILGANDGVLPARLQEDGIFSDEERRNLEKAGLELAPGIRRRLLDQQFLIYMALTRPSSILWVSYPRSDEEGRPLMPSLLITFLKDLFPSLKERFLQGDEEDMPYSNPGKNEAKESTAENIIPYLAHPRQTLSLLAAQLSRWKKGEKINHLWWDIYNWYVRSEKWREEGQRLLKGLFYRNNELPMDKSVSRRLYGKEWKASVSRLERYHACPFSQFLSYGLKLRERKLYRLESMDIGRFFHMALRNVTLSFQKKQVDFSSLDEKTCLAVVDEEVDKLIPKLQKEILLSTTRYQYLASRLKKTVGLAAIQMAEHYRRSRFRPIGAELSFGKGRDIPSPEFNLKDGSMVEMVGRIDRIDLARDKEGKAYLRIIDYKSGPANLLLSEIFYGLSLQLIAYLDIILSASPQWLQEDALPAGIFYFRVHAPLINAEGRLSREELAGELMKRFRMKGRLLADPEVIRLMDNHLIRGYSPVIPVGLNEKGGLYKNSAVLSLEQFAFLRKYVRFVLRSTAEEIAKGEVGIQPFKFGKKKACTFCAYKAVCQFDPSLEENTYRLLSDLEEKMIWNLLQRRLLDDGNS